MVSFGDDNTMIKIAVFGITMSILVTAMVTFLVAGSSDYDYDTIKGYQNDLVEFSGDSMLNETPWILSHVYTPFNPAAVADEDIPAIPMKLAGSSARILRTTLISVKPRTSN